MQSTCRLREMLCDNLHDKSGMEEKYYTENKLNIFTNYLTIKTWCLAILFISIFQNIYIGMHQNRLTDPY